MQCVMYQWKICSYTENNVQQVKFFHESKKQYLFYNLQFLLILMTFFQIQMHNCYINYEINMCMLKWLNCQMIFYCSSQTHNFAFFHGLLVFMYPRIATKQLQKILISGPHIGSFLYCLHALCSSNWQPKELNIKAFILQ